MIEPVSRHRLGPEREARFRQAWKDGVTVPNLADRFGIRVTSVHRLAVRLKLKRRDYSWI